MDKATCWAEAHRRRSAVVAVVLLLNILSSACTNDTSNMSSAAPPDTSTTAEASPRPSTPKYEVISKSTSHRADEKITYYVVMDPVDSSNDIFKQNAKLIVQAIAEGNNSPDFSVYIFDSAAAAEMIISPYSIPITELNDIKAHKAEKDRHLVALYSGGFDIDTARASTADSAYQLLWYPAASTDSPAVGKYLGREVWRP